MKNGTMWSELSDHSSQMFSCLFLKQNSSSVSLGVDKKRLSARRYAWQPLSEFIVFDPVHFSVWLWPHGPQITTKSFKHDPRLNVCELTATSDPPVEISPASCDIVGYSVGAAAGELKVLYEGEVLREFWKGSLNYVQYFDFVQVKEK